jgi:hypothetical protein
MLSATAQQYWLTVAAAFLACEALYHASHFCINKTATSLKATDRATLALKVVNIVHAAISGPVAFYFLFLQGDAATAHAVQRAVALDAAFAPQLFSAHIAAEQALALTCWTVGFMCWDLYRIDTWAKSGHGEKKLLIVHHVLSILVWPLASLYRVAGPFLLHFEYTELSSPFLQLRWVTQLFFGRGSRADKIMSMLFALSFFIVRSTNVHVVLHAAFYSRQYSLALHPELPLHVRLIGAVTAGLPALLNLFWTFQILKMGKKMLFPKPKRAKKIN